MTWKPSKYIDGPNGSGFYTAGIDIGAHAHAIEFHSKDRKIAEARRDIVLMLLNKGLAQESGEENLQ